MATQKEELKVNQEENKAEPGKKKRGKKGNFKKSKNPLSERFNIRVSKDEYLNIKASAKASDLSYSEYARKRILGKRIVSRSADMQYFSEIRDVAGQLKKLGGLQKELFNNSERGAELSNKTAKNLKLIHEALADVRAISLLISKQLSNEYE